MSNINLIPQTEVKEQNKTKAVKSSTVISFVFLVVCIFIGAYLFYLNNQISTQMDSVKSEINSLRSDVQGLSDVEISARNLEKKYNVLNKMFSERPKYSLVLQELDSRRPSDLEIQSLDVKPGSMNISGVADNYIAIANFVNNLIDKNFSNGISELKELFTEVSLNSVSLEGATNKVKFFIVVSFDESKIKS